MARKKKAAEEAVPVETPEEEVPTEETPPVEEAAASAEATSTESEELSEERIGDLMSEEPDDEPEEPEIPSGEPEPAAKATAETSEEGEPPKGKEAPTEEKPAAAETAPAPAAEEPQTPAGEPAVEEPAAPALTPEQQQEARVKWRSDTVEALAVGQYALTEEQADEYETSPGTLIPKLMSRVYLDAVENAAAAVMQLLPQAIAQVTQQTSQSDGLQDKFFDQWKQLNVEEHGSVLGKIGTTYRQNNPQATPDEFIRDVGAMTMVALKIPFEEAAPPVEEPSQTPAHKPLGPGGAPAPANAVGADNPYTKIADEYLTDDQ